jgi:hypothetical protein
LGCCVGQEELLAILLVLELLGEMQFDGIRDFCHFTPALIVASPFRIRAFFA